MEEKINEAENVLKTNLEQQEYIKEQMTLLPKGHINILYRKEKGYYYLTHREGKKICNDYLGPVGKTDLKELMDKLSEREKFKKELKNLKEEEKILKKSIKELSRNVKTQD